MRHTGNLPDLRPGDTIVTLTELRAGDIVRLERVDSRTVGLRRLGPEAAAADPGPLFRVETGERAGSVRLVQVRSDGPLN